jgi:hypothetical protein
MTSSTIKYSPSAEPAHVREPGPELDRGGRPRRRELHDPIVLAEREVSVEPPAEPLVERLGAVDVRDREQGDLEAQWDRRCPDAPFAPSSRACVLLIRTSTGRVTPLSRPREPVAPVHPLVPLRRARLVPDVTA